ncbi:unnamed protein product [Tilletia laevis]|nr:unnamed protein product [Tilletia laevis]
MVGGAWGASNGSSPRLDAGVFASQQRGGSTEIARGGGMGGPNAMGSSGIASPHASAALQSPVRGASAAAASGMGGGGAPPSAPPMGPARFGRAAAGGAPSKAGKKD